MSPPDLDQTQEITRELPAERRLKWRGESKQDDFKRSYAWACFGLMLATAATGPVMIWSGRGDLGENWATVLDTIMLMAGFGGLTAMGVDVASAMINMKLRGRP